MLFRRRQGNGLPLPWGLFLQKVARIYTLPKMELMADIYAALGGDFQVALHDIPQIGIRVELGAGFSLQNF